MLEDPDSPWEKAFPKFTSQLDAFAGKELSKVATANFSTTTSVSRAASQLTLMEAVKPYFAFVMIYIKCGIPEITLEGTPKDWQMVLDKTHYLKKYELSWWIDELEPLLKEFVKASNGNANKDFWRNMFKYHTLKEYGAPKVIDGWIVKFFPYTKTGKRNTLKSLSGTDGLPSEMVKVDLDFLTVSNEGTETTPLEMWAGFTGLEQNSKTFALKPAIGWMIRKKDSENDKRLAERIKKNYADDPYFGINIQVQTVPKEILELKEIKKLTISFIDKINIPDEMGKMKIEGFAMDGSIDEAGIKRICKLLLNTWLWINNKIYNE